MHNPDKISNSTRVLECSMPLYDEGKGPAVLIIHGFTGSPHDMAYLHGRIRDAGYTVYTPRLPGHGTSGDDFLQTGWRDWYRCAVDAYLELKARFGVVSVVGLSMGGVIAAGIAGRFPVEKLALAAPAFIFTPGGTASLIGYTPLLAPFTASLPIRQPDIDENSFTGDRLILEKEYKGSTWVLQGSELLKLRNRTRKVLKDISAPSLVIVSHADQTVSWTTAAYLKKQMTSTELNIIELENSAHVLVDDIDKEEVADAILKHIGD